MNNKDITLESDFEIVIFSDQKSFEDLSIILKERALSVMPANSAADVDLGDLIFLDKSWIYANDPMYVDMIIEAIFKEKKPVVFVDDELYLYKKSNVGSISKIYSDDVDTYGVFFDGNGNTYNHETKTESYDTSILISYSWAITMLSSFNLSESYSKSTWMNSIYENDYTEKEDEGGIVAGIVTQPVFTNSTWHNKNLECGVYGWLNVTSEYSKLFGNVDGYSYYKTHYYVDAVSKNNKRVADIFLNSNLPSTHELLTHGPTTSSGVGTVSYSYSVGISEDGLAANVSGGWQYSTNDVQVINVSNKATGFIDIWHDVNEKQNVGLGYTAEPGKTLRVPNWANNGTYNATDNHSAKFCKYGIVPIMYFPGLWKHVDSYFDFQTYYVDINVFKN